MRSRLLFPMALVLASACIDVDARSRSGSEAIVGPKGPGGGTVVTSVTMSPPSINLQSGGSCPFVANHQITATAHSSAGVVTSNPADFTWSSSNPSVGSVDQNGRVTLTGAVGTATVMAIHKASGIPGSTSITVTACGTQPPAGVSSVHVSPANVTLSVSGVCHPQTAQLTATVVGSPQTVNWSSNNPGRVTTDQNGLVRAIAVGSADVSATSTADASRSSFSRVTVVDCPSQPPPPSPGTITIDVNPPNFSGVVGGTSSFTATVTATGGLPTSVVWSLSDATCGTMTANGHSLSVRWVKNCPLVTVRATSTHNASIFGRSTGSISSGNVTCTATSSVGTVVSVNQTWTVTAHCTNQFGVPFDPYGHSSDPSRVLITGSTKTKVINGVQWPVGPQFTLRAVARGNARLTIQADVSDVTAIAVIDFTVQ